MGSKVFFFFAFAFLFFFPFSFYAYKTGVSILAGVYSLFDF